MLFTPHPTCASEVFGVVLAFSTLWPLILGCLAGLLLLSGLDDFVPLLICIWARVRRKQAFDCTADIQQDEGMIAVFVPCWQEAGVIGRMVRHNLSAIRYRNFHFFLGVYPNDEPTLKAIAELTADFSNVHLATCPHAGPTSKADCLNWIYQGMLSYEKRETVRFDTVVLHDAEDLIHPDAFSIINTARRNHAMVQVPVVPLPTPLHEVTHAVYCDEFAEFQTIDMPARQFSRSFVPSNGVGTGFGREILERLAEERGNRVFDPASLTEDYEIGVYIHRAGHSQFFVPLASGKRGFIATREYFPRKIRSAIRQRTRWVTGIALQSWERDGWRGPWRIRYWFWRDRKGLIANPLSFLTNLLFTAGLIDWFLSTAKHRPWTFAVSNPAVVALCWNTLLLQCFRLALRTFCVGRIFGFTLASGVVLRSLHANFINCCASFGAVWRYAHARAERRPLVWLKTEHAYPVPCSLDSDRRDLTDVLIASGYVSEEKMEWLRSRKPPETDLSEFLLSSGILSEQELCQAMSLHSGLPFAYIDVSQVNVRVLRSLPVHIQNRFSVVPFRVLGGRLWVAATRAPSATVLEQLTKYASVPIDFQLITRGNYEELRELVNPALIRDQAS